MSTKGAYAGMALVRSLAHQQTQIAHRNARFALAGAVPHRRTKNMMLVPIDQTKVALGAILNLARYKPPTTHMEAVLRLRLIDQIALQALGASNPPRP